MAFRQRRTGREGDSEPKEVRMRSWRDWKAWSARFSEAALPDTVMSTMLPEEMLGGRRMEGNSI